MSDDWTLWGVDGSDDLHDMTERMHETHELTSDCWCGPIEEGIIVKGPTPTGGHIYTHVSTEPPG